MGINSAGDSNSSLQIGKNEGEVSFVQVFCKHAYEMPPGNL